MRIEVRSAAALPCGTPGAACQALLALPCTHKEHEFCLMHVQMPSEPYLSC